MAVFLKKQFLSILKGKIGALLLKDNLKGLMKTFDYKEYGGAPLLGVKGYLVKAHGSSDEKAIMNGILFLEKYVKSNMLSVLEAAIEERRRREEVPETVED